MTYTVKWHVKPPPQFAFFTQHIGVGISEINKTIVVAQQSGSSFNY